MRIRPADVPAIEEPANDLVMRLLLRAEQLEHDSPALSATWVRLDGRHRRLRTDAGDRLYVVLDGTGVIQVGEDDFEVAPQDVVLVPRGTPYELQGDLTYLVINAPPFRDGDDVYLDE